MQLTKTTEFRWSNYLKPTPPMVLWIILTIEAVLLAINVDGIIEGSPKWVTVTLTIFQVLIGKAALFVGTIKNEYDATRVISMEVPANTEVNISDEIKEPEEATKTD